MDGSHPAGTPASPPIALPGEGWGDWRWLVLLLVLTAGLRAWQVANTEVTTRDSIGYVRYAWRLEHEPWSHVLRTGVQHPGYGFAVYLAVQPVRALLPDDLPLAMQRGAQLASCLASLLLVFPLFYLGKELFDRRVAFWATLLFQCLPSSGRMLPDGLSEPLFLLFCASALVAIVRALGTGRLHWFVLAGLATGLAYLTRTEGLIVVPVALLVLAGMQGTKRWRRSWLRTCGNGLGLVAACAVLVGPFMLHIGGVSLKASMKNMRSADGWKLPARASSEPTASSISMPLPLAMWAVWDIGPDVTPGDRWGWAAWALLAMLDKGFFHILDLPVVLGLWLFRRRFLEVPGLWVLLISGFLLQALLYKLGQSNGYVSERHTLLIVLGGVYFAVAALGAMAAWVGRWRPGWEQSIALVMLLAIVGLCVPRTLARLHGNRTGFREAGEWIAENTRPNDAVFDPCAWSHYYAGRVFDRGDDQSSTCYVVLERSRNPHPHLYYLLDLAEKLIERGEVVHRVPVRRGKHPAEILVYRVRRPPANHPVGMELAEWLAVN